MAYSTKTYLADGAENDFTVTFNYLDRSHVKVAVDKVPTDTVGSNYAFTWNNSTSLRVVHAGTGVPVPTGIEVKLFRATPIDVPAVVFGGGASLSSQNLNKNSDYLTYALQEATDSNEAFTKLYLGSFSTEPVTDNDGDTLQTGVVYYNSVTKALYYWTGVEWIIGESTFAAEVFSTAAGVSAAAADEDRVKAELARQQTQTAASALGVEIDAFRDDFDQSVSIGSNPVFGTVNASKLEGVASNSFARLSGATGGLGGQIRLYGPTHAFSNQIINYASKVQWRDTLGTVIAQLEPTLWDMKTAVLKVSRVQGDIENTFPNLSAFITWSSTANPVIGHVVWVSAPLIGAVGYVYDGTSDNFVVKSIHLDGWAPLGTMYCEHFAIYPTPISGVMVDYSSELQEALDNTDGDLLFTGFVRVTTGMISPRDCRPHCPFGRESGGIAAFSSFQGCTTVALATGGTYDTVTEGITAILKYDPGAFGTLGDFGWWFEQPVTVTGRDTVYVYPHALDISDCTRFTHDGSLTIQRGWNGVLATGNFGGLKTSGTWEIGCLNEPFHLDGALDFGYINHIHLWPFYFSSNTGLEAVYDDGVPTAFFGEWDGGGGIRSLEIRTQRIRINNTGEGGGPSNGSSAFNQIGHLALDGDTSQVIIENGVGGKTAIHSFTNTKNMGDTQGPGYLQSLIMKSGQCLVSNITHNGFVRLADVEGGNLTFSGGWITANKTDGECIRCTGGQFFMTNMLLNTAARTEAIVHQSGTARVVVKGVSSVGKTAEPAVKFTTNVVGNFVDEASLHPMTAIKTTGVGYIPVLLTI